MIVVNGSRPCKAGEELLVAVAQKAQCPGDGRQGPGRVEPLVLRGFGVLARRIQMDPNGLGIRAALEAFTSRLGQHHALHLARPMGRKRSSGKGMLDEVQELRIQGPLLKTRVESRCPTFS